MPRSPNSPRFVVVGVNSEKRPAGVDLVFLVAATGCDDKHAKHLIAMFSPSSLDAAAKPVEVEALAVRRPPRQVLEFGLDFRAALLALHEGKHVAREENPGDVYTLVHGELVIHRGAERHDVVALSAIELLATDWEVVSAS